MPFKVETEIKKSNITNAGLGVFTKEFIKKGSSVWYYNKSSVLELTNEQLETIKNSEHHEFNRYLTEYMYFNTGLNKSIIDLDNTKFINHSYEPNTINTGYESIALRDIEIGEEIYENYNDYGAMPENMDYLHKKYNIWLPETDK